MASSSRDVPKQRQPFALLARLRAYIPAEGHEGLAIRDGLLREAADEIERLRREIADITKEADAQMREVAAESAWKERQGDDYGSY